MRETQQHHEGKTARIVLPRKRTRRAASAQAEGPRDDLRANCGLCAFGDWVILR
jgi:hypothetical protein